MTIPGFDEKGNLPPGIHWTTWLEFQERFGTNVTRLRQIEGLKKAMEQLKAAGCRTIYINGSFVTSKPRPVDVNYLLTHAPRLLNPIDRDAQKAIYKGEIFPSEQPVGIYEMNSLEFFQKDRNKNAKGIIAIDLLRWEA
ncbi:MAG: hypothetical protein F6J98_01120 [Moorea sp. SIO4G2]|uniref:DUF6932 family protein n=1 Tax=unclassified Moorena TaxID=2683338 RepID=UPI0013F71A00|nr:MULTISPECIES: hypothetical protein [unclassified Moorena]NEO11336.1 hypothetical protein [Moorena sp. SIO3E8]NEO59068.1 hypothetical protein [Moorena sp. SIO4G2]NEP97887.1 hypothetical protein [Moorena sp. SIO3F7]